MWHTSGSVSIEHEGAAKSELTPTQEIKFLGFTVNSTKLELRLPGEKIKKIRAEAGKVLQSD